MKSDQPKRGCRSTKSNSAHSRKGFTLVELLVVIVIIAVLGILSFFSASKMRGKARGATCASNLRQIGTAMLSYASDNNSQLPPLEDRTGSNDGLKGIWTQIIADADYLGRSTNWNGLDGCNAGV